MSGCIFPACERPVAKVGRFCAAHYERLRRKDLHRVVTRVCRCGQLLVSKHSPAPRPAAVRTDRGGGQCTRCYVPGTQAEKVPAEPAYRAKQYSLDELMAEWDFLRGHVRFEDFGPRVGLKPESWERAYHRAKAAGDPRARRAANDPATWPDPAAGTKHLLSRKHMSGAAQRREKREKQARRKGVAA